MRAMGRWDGDVGFAGGALKTPMMKRMERGRREWVRKEADEEGERREEGSKERRRRGRTSFFQPFNHPSISSLWKTCPQGRIRTTSPSWKSSRQIEHCERERGQRGFEATCSSPSQLKVWAKKKRGWSKERRMNSPPR